MNTNGIRELEIQAMEWEFDFNIPTFSYSFPNVEKKNMFTSLIIFQFCFFYPFISIIFFSLIFLSSFPISWWFMKYFEWRGCMIFHVEKKTNFRPKHFLWLNFQKEIAGWYCKLCGAGNAIPSDW